MGVNIETVAEITPDRLPNLQPGLPLLTPAQLGLLPPETIAQLPANFLDSLDPALRVDLDKLAAELGGAGAKALPSLPQTPPPLPQVTPLPLAESWIEAAASVGRVATTTTDAAPSAMNFLHPRFLLDLTPEMWRALRPETLELAFTTDLIEGKYLTKLERSGAQLDPLLLLQLQTLLAAAGRGLAPPALPLPATWLEVAAANDLPLKTTADLSPELLGGLVWARPELLDDLTDEMTLAFSPETQAALPTAYIAALAEGMRQTLHNVQAHRALIKAEAEAEAGEGATGVIPEASPTDPARLSPEIIAGARQGSGLEIEYAYDIEPETMRQLGAFGRAGLKILGMFTPGNLKAMRPEVIAVLPPVFVDTLDPTLRAELDQRAADFGGAGGLARQEAEQAAATAATETTAPPLTGPWVTELDFLTAADILNNPFVPGAAAFLNLVPASPNVADPVAWLVSLSPEVLQYLAEKEAGFVSNLSPAILEMMSPDALTFLLEAYPDAFAPEVTARLRGIASGQVKAFIPVASLTRTNGQPSLLLNVFRNNEANTVSVAHSIFDLLADYQTRHPEVNISFVFEQSSLIEDSLQSVAREGTLGAIFTIIVILIFLSGRRGGKYRLNWAATLVIAVSIPFSILAALALMRWLPPTLGEWLKGLADGSNNPALTFISTLFPAEFTLNIMTLSGLTVVIGRVVDDSIVTLENIYRFIQQGDEPKAAVRAGTRQVAMAIFASTATTIAVFLPLGLIGGVVGSFFLPFALTTTYALVASFLAALTLVPTLAFLLIRQEGLLELRETMMQRWYTPILQGALRHRGVALVIAAVIFMSSLALLGRLPRSFIPSFGEPTINVTIELPGNTTMSETDQRVRTFEQAIAELTGLKTVQVEVGSSGGFRSFFGNSGVSQNQANVTISLTDPTRLESLTGFVRHHAEQVFGPGRAIVSGAARSGISGFSLVLTGQSDEQLRAVLAQVKTTLSQLDADGNGQPDLTNVISNLDRATVSGSDTLIRLNGQPAVSFSGELNTDDTLGLTETAQEAVAALNSLPAGVGVAEGFNSQQQTSGFAGTVAAIGYSILLVYAIMALTFRSLVQPFTILFSLPFALVGAALALFLTGSALNISALIGLLMLVGIVVTNAIVLLELVQQLRRQGKNAEESLLEAGRTRLRPIWMTALTTVLALLPLAASRANGTLIAAELATTVIGGLLVSTLLTLVVVPVVYSLLDQVRGLWRR